MNILKYIYGLLLLMAFMSCGQRNHPVAQLEESREAKQLLQGVWMDEDTESIVFKMKGDSVYYPDSTSQTVCFKVIGDTLYIGSTARYPIEKHASHLLWFRSQDGELVKLVKSDDDEESSDVFKQNTPQILTVNEVLKRDSVVMYNGERYHLYVVVNPTKYKVTRHALNDEGLDVENVYYDNIIHVSVYHGAKAVFSRDFNKQFYAKKVPETFLQQSILNNIEYASTDDKGFHFNASICIPDEASCYLVEHIISFDGKLNTQVSEN